MRTLLIGGARSGKSALALRWSNERSSNVCTLVTGTESDPEMTARIAAHRRERPAHWRVREEPVYLGRALREEALELLGHLPALRSLFEGLDRDSTLDVENALEWIDLPAGETLFKQGDAAPDAYVVTAGHLAVVMGAGACRRTVARIGPGEVVGEMALLADAPRSATVVALHDSYLIRLPRRAFDVVMEGAPDARRYLFRVLTSRLQHTSSGDAPAGPTIVAPAAIGPTTPGPSVDADSVVAPTTSALSSSVACVTW